jgi:hypothetical protein
VPLGHDRLMSADRSGSDRVDDDGPVGSDRPPNSWIVWRQDDNGNRFEVARFRARADADALAATMEARGHKQTYWVAVAE